MKAACAKCTALENPPPPPLSQPTKPSLESNPNKDTISDPENTIFANQQAFDPEKLNQAIFSYRPVSFNI